MNKPRMLQIIAEAESKIDELDKAFYFDDHRPSRSTMLILAGNIDNLDLLAGEEPLPKQIDKQNLLETIKMASIIVDEVRIASEDGDFRHGSIASHLLRYVLDDLRELINDQKSETWKPPKQPWR